MLYCKLLAIKHLAFIDILNFPTSFLASFLTSSFLLSTNFFLSTYFPQTSLKLSTCEGSI